MEIDYSICSRQELKRFIWQVYDNRWCGLLAILPNFEEKAWLLLSTNQISVKQYELIINTVKELRQELIDENNME